MESKVVKFNFPPDSVLKWIKDWAKQSKKKASDLEKKMLDDVVTLSECGLTSLCKLVKDEAK